MESLANITHYNTFGLVYTHPSASSDPWEIEPLTYSLIAKLGVSKTMKLLKGQTVTYRSPTMSNTTVRLAVTMVDGLRTQGDIRKLPKRAGVLRIDAAAADLVLNNYVINTKYDKSWNLGPSPKYNILKRRLNHGEGTPWFIAASFTNSQNRISKIYTASDILALTDAEMLRIIGNTKDPYRSYDIDGQEVFVIMSRRYHYQENIDAMTNLIDRINLSDCARWIGDAVSIANETYRGHTFTHDKYYHAPCDRFMQLCEHTNSGGIIIGLQYVPALPYGQRLRALYAHTNEKLGIFASVTARSYWADLIKQPELNSIDEGAYAILATANVDRLRMGYEWPTLNPNIEMYLGDSFTGLSSKEKSFLINLIASGRRPQDVPCFDKN